MRCNKQVENIDINEIESEIRRSVNEALEEIRNAASCEIGRN